MFHLHNTSVGRTNLFPTLEKDKDEGGKGDDGWKEDQGLVRPVRPVHFEICTLRESLLANPSGQGARY